MGNNEPKLVVTAAAATTTVMIQHSDCQIKHYKMESSQIFNQIGDDVFFLVLFFTHSLQIYLDKLGSRRHLIYCPSTSLKNETNSENGVRFIFNSLLFVFFSLTLTLLDFHSSSCCFFVVLPHLFCSKLICALNEKENKENRKFLVKISTVVWNI